MAALTHLPHGSIRRDENDARRVDVCEVGAALGNHGVEPAVGALDDLRSSLVGASGLAGIALDDLDSPAGELEQARVDAREAELENATGTIPEQLEDLRRRGGGESGRKPMHGYARYMSEKGRGKFLGVPYDWRRPTWQRYKSRWWNPKERRIVMPRAFGWGWDFNVAEILRRLGLRH
jgi:hypothetical protein